MDEKNTRTRCAINAVIAALTAFSWLWMVFGWGTASGFLMARGIRSLRYFTVLSNLLSGIVSGMVAVRLARGRSISQPLLCAKLAATTSVTLTLVVVMVLLGPTMGWAAMFAGPNLYLHLVLPLIAIFEFCRYEEGDLPRGASFAAIVPAFIYGVWYFGNVLVNGVGEPPSVNDFYGFFAFGEGTWPIVFAIIAVAVWLMAFALIRLRAVFLSKRG